jgi:hypothetical protein
MAASGFARRWNTIGWREPWQGVYRRIAGSVAAHALFIHTYRHAFAT